MKFRSKLWILIPVFVSGLLSFYQLGRQSFWLDEMLSLNIAMISQLSSVFWDNHPPLYHLLLKPWLDLFGDSEVAARSLSCLFSMGTTAVLGLWGFRKSLIFGFSLALLHALHPTVLLYSQEARMYSLFELTASLQLIAFFDFLKDSKNTRKFLNLSFCSILLGLTHFGAILLLFLQSVIFFSSLEAELKRKILPWFISIFLGLFIVFLFWFQFDFLGWQEMKFSLENAPKSFLDLAQNLTFHSTFAALVLAISLIGAWQKKRLNQRMKINAFLVVGSLVFILMASLILHRSFFQERYLIFTVPSIVMLAADLIFLIPTQRKWVPFTVLAFFILSFASVLPDVYKIQKAPWRQLAQQVALSPSPIVLTTRTLAVEYPYFFDRGIPVGKVQISEAGFREATKLVEGHTIWVIENYFGALPYFMNWKDQWVQAGFQVETIDLQDESSEPVYALKISIRNSQTPEDPGSKAQMDQRKTNQGG